MANFPIVGIGSSAGGLEALQKLFGAMPPDSGLAFVIAAHLDPTQKSHLAELLGRSTKMPVVQIDDSAQVVPDHVYVIAPDQELAIRDGVVKSNKPTAPRGHRHPVDSFFRSLAEDQGERAIAIVLSGTGTNGSLGLRFIKAEGGIAIAQQPDTASFQGMPRSAVGTGVVDLVLPPEKMPESLLSIARHVYVREPAKVVEQAAPEEQLRTLLTLVRAQSKRDFSSHKKSTLLRRIHRRMGLHRIDLLGTYIERLRSDPVEIKALAADLAINVTGFFRDPEAWRELERKVIVPLVEERPANSTIRVWVPGCSTGEEAYSIAMLILERAGAAKKSLDLRLFATDVAEATLATARAGVYPASIEQDIEPERVQRWFERVDDTYCVRKALRDTITFAPQDLLQDPPFSRLDLISCRNLLIYLKADAQKKILALFHFALREDGHLFLGPAETVAGQEDLFQPVSKRWRIYHRIGPTRHDLVNFPIVKTADPSLAGAEEPGSSEPRAREILNRAVLERHAPASVLIDPHYRVHYFLGPTVDYLGPPSGEPTHHLLAMARPGLRTALRAAIRRALNENQEVTTSARVRRADAMNPVQLVVTPLKTGRGDPSRLMVSFFERAAPAEASAPAEIEALSEGQLQAELDITREDLRLTLEQMESSHEELQASNEEILSINEELQASNEELETSKEELQSLNEELNTVNNQLQAKVGESEQRTDDLNNLLKSSDVATLFLDRNLCIRWFTPSMRALLDLLPTDIGRPVSHFAQRFSGGNLVEDARKVLERLQPSDAEVVDDLGRWYIRHILPYRTGHDRIDGVVVTFTDITGRKQAEQALADELKGMIRLHELSKRALRATDLQELLEEILDATIELHGADLGNIQLLDDRRKTLRMAAQRGFEKRFLEHFAEVDAAESSACGLALARPAPVAIEDVEQEPAYAPSLEEARAAGYRAVHSAPLLTSSGKLLGIMSVHFREPHRFSERELRLAEVYARLASDAIAAQLLQESLRQSEQRLRKVLETDAIGVMFFDHNGTLIGANEVFLRRTGYSRSQVEAGELTWRKMTPPEWMDVTEAQMRKLAETGHIGPYEKEHFLKDGSRAWMLFAGADLGDGTVVEYCLDISDRKRAEAERELLARELSHRVKNILAVAQALAMQTDGSGSVEEFRDTFVGRLQALARAHSLLLDANWRSADLKSMVEQATAAYRVEHPEVIEIEGESVPITPRQGLGVSLILHELSTNAAKHGALSGSEGGANVSWWIEEVRGGRRLHLLWREHDAALVEPPKEKGFGTLLIERACTHELEGEVELDYAVGGLRCEVIFPLP